MEVEVDHYAVLGLPSGEEGARLTDKEISRAYRVKALELHPDKRPDDPNAHDNFQRLKTSYEILNDDKARRLFDDLLRVKREQQRRHFERDSRKRKMVSDLEERERSSFGPDSTARERSEEERITQKLKEEIERIRAMHARKVSPAASTSQKTEMGSASVDKTGVDKQKILKVSWDKVGEEYSAERLKEVFSEFGSVEDIITKSTKSKKRGSALIVMTTRESAAAAMGTVCGDLSNPLLVLPLESLTSPEPPTFQKPVKTEKPEHSPGLGYQAFEDSVLKKLKEAAAKQKK